METRHDDIRVHLQSCFEQVKKITKDKSDFIVDVTFPNCSICEGEGWFATTFNPNRKIICICQYEVKQVF